MRFIFSRLFPPSVVSVCLRCPPAVRCGESAGARATPLPHPPFLCSVVLAVGATPLPHPPLLSSVSWQSSVGSLSPPVRLARVLSLAGTLAPWTPPLHAHGRCRQRRPEAQLVSQPGRRNDNNAPLLGLSPVRERWGYGGGQRSLWSPFQRRGRATQDGAQALEM